MTFKDRAEAGRLLGRRLNRFRGQAVVVLGLPRGGVPVALEVARTLGAPLDVIVVRKLGVPSQPELAMGAIGEGGVRVVNRDVVSMAHVTDGQFAAVEARERAKLEGRARRFRAERPRLPLAGRTAIVVDDGIATGSTARAACQVAKRQGATRVVLAVPVAPPGWTVPLAGDADEFVCVDTPEPFYAVGQFYDHFSQTTDEQVIDCLRHGPTMPMGSAIANSPPTDEQRDEVDEDVEVHAGSLRLAGRLTIPVDAKGVVVFAHGSGSSRHSPRNRHVAGVLNGAGLGTLLFDLLTVDEELQRAKVFNIELLAERLADASGWLRAEFPIARTALGYFGASTGAAAALWAAADHGARIAAIVSRGGRPDLAHRRLAAVTSPTLLIVGGRDDVVLGLNREAQDLMRCETRLAIVPGATHLFEETGTLQQAAELARDWFVAHLDTTGAHPTQRATA